MRLVHKLKRKKTQPKPVPSSSLPQISNSSLLFCESRGKAWTPSQPFSPKLNIPKPPGGTLRLRTRAWTKRTAAEMVTGHVLSAAGTAGVGHLAGRRGRRGPGSAGCAGVAGGEAVGSAINTPAPGRASAPPGPRGRISARRACCAGTQNTSRGVKAVPRASPPSPGSEPDATPTRGGEARGRFPNGGAAPPPRPRGCVFLAARHPVRPSPRLWEGLRSWAAR